MPRFETSTRRDDSQNKPRTGLFQRLWKNKAPEAQKAAEKPTPKPFKKFGEIFKHASTPREKELVQKGGEVKKETRGLLARLREDVEPSKRSQINELRKKVTSNPDISRDREAVKAYQELIKLTDPERFQREIGTADGIYGPRTRKAYEADKQTLDKPRTAILTSLSSNTPKETPQARTERTHGSGWLRNLFNANNAGASAALGMGKFKSLPPIIKTTTDSQGRKRTMTYCSQTARENMERLGLNDVPRGNADTILGQYRWGGKDIVGLSTGGFNAPAGAKVADIMMSTGRQFGHRSMAYRQGRTWYVNDPYVAGTGSIPLNKYESMLRARGWKIQGTAFYDQGAIS